MLLIISISSSERKKSRSHRVTYRRADVAGPATTHALTGVELRCGITDSGLGGRVGSLVQLWSHAQYVFLNPGDILEHDMHHFPAASENTRVTK